jgi:hypothetical protein
MICRICGREFDISANALVIKRRFGIGLYHFPNGDVHEFTIQKLGTMRTKYQAPLTPVEQITPAVPEPVSDKLLIAIADALKELSTPQTARY